MALVSIDLGIKRCGVAVWHWQKLHSAFFVDDVDLLLNRLEGLHLVAIARPQVKRIGDSNDLISLALVAGTIAGKLLITYPSADAEFILPSQWKGRTSKAISNKRTRAELSATEMACVELPPVKAFHHNVWNAIGIGLWIIKQDESTYGRRLSGKGGGINVSK